MSRIFATLVAIPALVLSAGASTLQPGHSSAVLVAAATAPAFTAAVSRAIAASVTASVAGTHVNLVIKQALQEDAFAVPVTSDSTVANSAPILLTAVKTELTPQEFANGSAVTVRLTVDRNGIPQNILVEHATTDAIAQKTMDAVAQYRFKPATKNYLAVSQDVTLDVKINQ